MDDLIPLVAWFSAMVTDFVFRMTGGRAKLYNLKALPVPGRGQLARADIVRVAKVLNQRLGDTGPEASKIPQFDHRRALLDAIMAEIVEASPHEYARVLSTFPLLDRDQPALPHDYRIRPTKRRIEWRKISFITRDLALLTYFDYLAGRSDVKPDPDRVKRICPDGVPEPPEDIVEFFAEAGVDIDGKTDYAVAATGPYRNLRERVAKARELGAVAYVPTIDRRRATFVEQASKAGGLSPEEGVLTLEMAQCVLRAKAEREAKWERAMQLWKETPDPRGKEESVPTTEPTE